MKEHKLIKKIMEQKCIAFRLRGRREMEWEDDVKQDLKVTEIYHWIN
jgi:hypothetical protein